MNRFEEIETIGDGAFGIVTKCRDKQTGELVAIKKMKQKYSSFEECLQLKEVKSLRRMKHENVIRLLQVFRENGYLYLVFELGEKSLLRTINEKGSYTEPEVKSIMKQIFSGLAYIHRQGFFHRDIKPDNLLWKGDKLKIADFGLAREIRSMPPYTEYVSTRWYRAPEIILKSPNYNSPVDIWAAGVIMAELYTGKPLFPGISEQDQLYKTIAILGSPNSKNWPDGIRLANKHGVRFNPTPSVNLATIIPNASKNAINLLQQLLQYDPSKRPSASQALQHPFFQVEPDPPPVTSTTINNESDLNTQLENSKEPSLETLLNQIMTSPSNNHKNKKGLNAKEKPLKAISYKENILKNMNQFEEQFSDKKPQNRFKLSGPTSQFSDDIDFDSLL
ncbi:CMGC family protein kinase [Histomonas meleagridis]|uniref:CMGC family protein kinase n=1 Tax=Histomonas meleagridis TaxID=135588 RepID=UPI003559F90E|nr:CMGC family protein kinase [Histomonas meleagridis]KAH0797962.1 CMGC family protein kinase [Histomonas meleagridis]